MAEAGAAPPGGGQGLSGRATSNLQLEVLSQQAVQDEQEAGDAGTAQTLHELCSSECPPACQCGAAQQRQPTLLQAMACHMLRPPGLPRYLRPALCLAAQLPLPLQDLSSTMRSGSSAACSGSSPHSRAQVGGVGGFAAASPAGAAAEVHAPAWAMCRAVSLRLLFLQSSGSTFGWRRCGSATPACARAAAARCPTKQVRVQHSLPAQPTSTAYQHSRCFDCWGGHSCVPSCSSTNQRCLIVCAAVWLLEEEEEIKGGHVPVGGQASLSATCVKPWPAT